MKNYKFKIPFGQGKWIYQQEDKFALSARAHIDRIKRIWDIPEYFYHLQAGGHVEALNIHLNNTWFCKIDLSTFFNNITRNRVRRRLKCLHYKSQEANDFAASSTVCFDKASKKFALPYGFVQSPILASIDLDMSTLGRCLLNLNRNEICVSVYMDDIILSSNSKDKLKVAYDEIINSVFKTNYILNKDKSFSPQQKLSAFNINVENGDMAIEHQRFADMCSRVSACGISNESDGIFHYVRTVNIEQAKELLQRFPNSFTAQHANFV